MVFFVPWRARHPLRVGGRGCCRRQDAALLSVRGHGQHCFEDGEQWTGGYGISPRIHTPYTTNQCKHIMPSSKTRTEWSCGIGLRWRSNKAKRQRTFLVQNRSKCKMYLGKVSWSEIWGYYGKKGGRFTTCLEHHKGNVHTVLCRNNPNIREAGNQVEAKYYESRPK